VCRVHHKPLKIRLVDESGKKRFPNALVAPTAKAPLHGVPITQVGRQIAPRSARAQYPENGVDKEAVILAQAAPDALTARQKRRKKFPNWFADVVSSMCGWFFHPASLADFKSRVDTP